MNDRWKYQLRIDLADEIAERARHNSDDPIIMPLAEILGRHNAKLKCQFDAFSGYVAEAEKNGVDSYPLHKWTKATIDDPIKKAKYLKSFTLYVDGDEVYEKEKADALESELQPLVGGELVTRMSKHDTNPTNNPQPPKKYRK